MDRSATDRLPRPPRPVVWTWPSVALLLPFICLTGPALDVLRSSAPPTDCEKDRPAGRLTNWSNRGEDASLRPDRPAGPLSIHYPDRPLGTDKALNLKRANWSDVDA